MKCIGQKFHFCQSYTAFPSQFFWLAAGEAGPSNIPDESPGASRSRKSRGAGAPSRPLPVNVCKQVIQSLAEQEKWKGWAFDGRKNIYTSEAFMNINQEHKFVVSLNSNGFLVLPHMSQERL